MAMNTHRQLGTATANGAKSMEKLSSGFRINRAGDDAAGLAISEKMRGQIRGLNQASSNSQDGISLIQTAEGALNETHAILQRMRELSVQASTDTNTGEDREKIQAEVNQLSEEIDRISKTTEFNTQGLLDGSFNGTFQIGANESQTVDLQIGKMDTSGLGLTSSITSKTTGATKLVDGSYTVNDAGDALLDAKGNTVGTIATNVITLADSTTVTFGDLTGLEKGSTITVKGDDAVVRNELSGDATKIAAGNYEISGTNVLKDNKVVGSFATGTATIDGVDITNANLGLDAALADGAKFTINGTDVSSRAKAEASITSINNALEKVSTERSNLGAMQNRLEHTIKNLDTSAENLQQSESRIRDVDMAKEMMEQTKNNILQQASQAMLAQANQQPSGVLQLLG